MNEEKSPPKIFISYSHDNAEHKRWVTDFASKLRNNGIDAILDLWEIGPGDDIPKFMENSVKSSDRVLLICSELYVHKADDGQGGVGYEAMIVTGELIKDLGTSKFIPIICPGVDKPILPNALSTRYYIDLSKPEIYEENFERLLRDLHKAPVINKPVVGNNPFDNSKSIMATPKETIEKKAIIIKEKIAGRDTIEIYQEALSIARDNDQILWRRLVRESRQMITLSLKEWREKHENIAPSTEKELVEQTLEGASIYSPVIAVALAGIESGSPKFNNQISIMDDILYPKNWEPGGLNVVVELPESIAYIYQALHGALCLYTNQLDLAKRFAFTNVENRWDNTPKPIWKNHGLIGWPKSLSGNCSKAWEILMSLPNSWPWLKEVFGDDYQSSLVSYYLALNVFEYFDLLASSNGKVSESTQLRLDIPLSFMTSDNIILRRGYRIFTNNIEQLKEIWRSMSISDSNIALYWEFWIKLCESWLSSGYRYGFRWDCISMHRNLIKEFGIPLPSKTELI